MRRSKEIMVLLALLVGMMIFVSWYVIDRRSRRHAKPAPTATVPVTPAPAQPLGPPGPVDLTQHDGQTIDFSSGRPVVKDSAADQAAIDAALKDMTAAAKDVTFEGTAKKPAPAAPPPKP